MRSFWKELLLRLERGPACLVSILSSTGSTPRGAGAVMAVFPDGACLGTIGGGNVEYAAQRLAAGLLARGENALQSFRFLQGDAASLGMVCGGEVQLHFHALSPGDADILRRLEDPSDTGLWLLRRLKGAEVREMRVVSGADRAEPEIQPLLREQAVFQADGWFSLPAGRPGLVYLFGGGHVSQALAALLGRTGFRCVVLDDRPEFADPARFPAAEQVLLCDFDRLELSITPWDYIVIMTRGHQADYEVLTQTLHSGAKYIGCIGSRAKLDLCRRRLLENGFTPEEYSRLHAPIGLNIGAQTPEEIAVAVAAELIAVRAGAAIQPQWEGHI